MSRLPKLTPAVTTAMHSYWPRRLKANERELLDDVLPVARARVAALAPRTPKAARTYMWAAVRYEIWGRRILGTSDPEILWHPHNTFYFASIVNRLQKPGWQYIMRGALQDIGRIANPAAWPQGPPRVGRAPYADPYKLYQQTRYRAEARLPGRLDRPARLFVVGAALGMALSGPAIRAAHVEDLVELDDGRIGARVEGRYAAVVPARREYTDVIREAAEMTGTGRFVTKPGKNAVYNIAARLTDEGLSLRRARASYLVAVLEAGLGIPAIRALAGPVSMNTLDALVPAASAALTPEEAIAEGLRT